MCPHVLNVLRPLTAMTEVTENASEETSLIEAFETSLDISEDAGLSGSASEQTNSRDELGDGHTEGQQDGQPEGRQEGQPEGRLDGQQDGQVDGQQDGQPEGRLDGQQDGQVDGQQDGQLLCPESKWVVGAQCRAVWSEDGRVYPATVVSVDGQRCRVRFSGYGNQGDVELSALQSPDTSRTQNCQDWRPGSRCRAVYSEDRLVYPAVVLWVKGQRCRVRFDDYNNEEEVDISDLLHPDELHGPSRAARTKGWKSSVTSNLDWKRRERGGGAGGAGGGAAGGGGGETRCKDEEPEKEESSDQRKMEKEAEVKKTGNQEDQSEKATNHSFCFFPPQQPGSVDPMSFIPPPLCPPCPPCPPGVDSSSMLMLWYMCGFHTGSFLAHQQLKSGSKH